MAATNFYQPNPNMWPQQPYQMPVQMQQQENPMVWVKGEAQAENYPTRPNATVVLWDQEQDSIYIKSTDVLGKPSIKILDYKIRENTPVQEENRESNYVTKDDLAKFMSQITEQLNQLKPAKVDRKFKED